MNNKEEPKQELPQLGTKEFNDLASVYFGGNPKKETDWEEQPKQETTLEEAAEKSTQLWFNNNDFTKELFIAGAKWQAERMYSEGEVLDILFKHTEDMFKGTRLTLTEWFEQFKKKPIWDNKK
jgi:hypothetical protein